MHTEYIKKLDAKFASHGLGLLKLGEESKLPGRVRRILENFDHWQEENLRIEAKKLADGGITNTNIVALPVALQRTVIREALIDLAILDLVEIVANPTAQPQTMIPFEERLGHPPNDGIVYENTPIPRVSLKISMHPVWIKPVKLSFVVTNEIAHFSAVIGQEFSAIERNIISNSRLVQELIARRIANEMQRAADSFEAIDVNGENLATKLTGSTSLIKTINFPIVRPHQETDISGTSRGNPENPITITINGSQISPFDGTGKQSAGIYWVIENANLGYIRLVDQVGAPTTPTHSSGSTAISYSYATNVIKFDLKLPAGTEEYVHLDGALRAFGQAKTNLSRHRYIAANFAIMSPYLNDLLTRARMFTAAGSHMGTSLSSQGDLEIIHGVPCWGTNIPSDVGRERIILGERGTVKYVVAKSFMTGAPFEAQDGNGAALGAKIAYGEEYSAVCVPTPIRKKLTSIILFNSDDRTAAI